MLSFFDSKFEPMFIRTALLITVLLISLAGCSRVTEEQSKLIGNWQIADAETVSERVSSEDASTAKMTIEFQSGGKFVTNTKMGSIDSTKQGTWEVVSFDAANNVMTIQCELLSQKTQCEIHFLKPNEIEWIPPNMAGTTQKIKFRKTD